MVRPKVGEEVDASTQISVRVTEDMLQDLRKIAGDANRPIARIIRQFIQDGLSAKHKA